LDTACPRDASVPPVVARKQTDKSGTFRLEAAPYAPPRRRGNGDSRRGRSVFLGDISVFCSLFQSKTQTILFFRVQCRWMAALGAHRVVWLAISGGNSCRRAPYARKTCAIRRGRRASARNRDADSRDRPRLPARRRNSGPSRVPSRRGPAPRVSCTRSSACPSGRATCAGRLPSRGYRFRRRTDRTEIPAFHTTPLPSSWAKVS